jgi:cell division protein FtsW (lipid II flippase)
MGRARFPVRLSAELGFALTWAAGLLVLIGGGAQTSWLAIQAGAGFLALALFLSPIRRKIAQWAPRAILVVPLMLLGTLYLDPGVEGVHRWLSIGPLRLHMGLLLLPAFMVVYASGRPKNGIIALLFSVIMLARQPDLAMLIGMSSSLAVIALVRRNNNDYAMLLLFLVLLIVCNFTSDPLGPVALVEGVLTESWSWRSWTGPIALLGAFILPTALVMGKWPVESQNLPSYVLAAMWSGLLLSSLIGPYPVPLLGYGASAVIGFGLATCLLPHAADRRIEDAA